MEQREVPPSGSSMGLYTFVEGRLDYGGEFFWEDLYCGEDLSAHKDLRFSLWKGRVREPTAVAFMLDFDNVPTMEGDGILAKLKEHVRWKFHLVRTGNGFHVYLPLEEAFGKADVRAFQKGYRKFAEGVAKHIGWECDPRVFGACKYGRVPGSVNSKGGGEVEYVGSGGGRVLKNLELALDREDTPPETREGEDGLENGLHPQSISLEKNCPMVRHALKNKVGHSLWLILAKSLAIRGERKAAYKMTGLCRDETRADVDGIFDGPGYAPMHCRTATLAFAEAHPEKENPCTACPHSQHVESLLPEVTGPLATPGFLRGFRRMKKTKRDDGEAEWTATIRVHVPQVVSYWINLHHAGIVRDKLSGKWYRYDAGKEAYAPFTYEAKSKTLEPFLHKELVECIYPVMYHVQDMGALAKEFGSLFPSYAFPVVEVDRPGLVRLTNGVLDTATGGRTKDYRGSLLTAEGNMSYTEGAESETLRKALVPQVGEEGYELAGIFLASAIGGLPTCGNQSILWLHGDTGSGKSSLLNLFARILRNLYGESSINWGMSEFVFSFGQRMERPLERIRLIQVDDFKVEGPIPAKMESALNTLASRETMAVRIPYEKPYDAPCRYAVAVSANDFPSVEKASEGLVRRLRPLSFYNRLTGAALGDWRRLLASHSELEKVFSWAVDLLKVRLRAVEEGGTFFPPLTPNEKALLEEAAQDRDDMFPEIFVRLFDVSTEFAGGRSYGELHSHYVRNAGLANKMDRTEFIRELKWAVSKRTGRKFSEFRWTDGKARGVGYVRPKGGK